MRVVFMGTPSFAVPTLHGLLEKGHNVTAVYTQPPRGRLPPSPVHQSAQKAGLPIFTPPTWKDKDVQATFLHLPCDVVVVVAYGSLLPPPVLQAPPLGCINVHASSLPRWRGAAPLQRALLAGDSHTGVSIMLMDQGLDTGPLLDHASLAIRDDETTQSLGQALSCLGADLLCHVLERLPLTPKPQPEVGVTYAHKVTKEEGRIDWGQPALDIDRSVRALAPGCWFTYQGERFKVLEARPASQDGPPGHVMAPPLQVGCGKGSLCVLRLQRQGRRAMRAEECIRGFPLPVGTHLA